MSEELIGATFTDEFTDFAQVNRKYQIIFSVGISVSMFRIGSSAKKFYF